MISQKYHKIAYLSLPLLASWLLLSTPSSNAQNGSAIQQLPNAWQYVPQGAPSAPGGVTPTGMTQQSSPSLYGQTQMQYQPQTSPAQPGTMQTGTMQTGTMQTGTMQTGAWQTGTTQARAQQPGAGQALPAQTTTAPITDVIMSTTSTVEGYRITSYKGLVEGVVVRLPTWQQNMAAGFQGIFGGSVEAYAQMCEQGRIQAYNQLMERARNMGANAVVGIRFDSESFSTDKSNFANAVVCYGTAVVIAPLP